ncbi:MAG: RsmB/NOP family class I SAM-dependent RNA methyltransferase [Bacteroidia bacterium]
MHQLLLRLMREHSYLLKAKEIISALPPNEPLRLFLKKYFRQHREMGSHDRKIASSVVYNFFRLGKTLPNLETEQRIAIANFLLQNETSPLLHYLLTSYSSLNAAKINLPLEEKINLVKQLYPEFAINDIFPFEKHLSEEIDKDSFFKSFLVQPLVWIRIREGFVETILREIKQLEVGNWPLAEKEKILSFEPSTPLDKTKSYQKGFFEIQDVSSQQTANYFEASKDDCWWDCCAGSGGKSLLFKDKFPEVKLLVTDSREAILQNAKERFTKAGVKNYQIKTLDLLSPNPELPTHNSLEGIIADVPCTGSGTWARTPEMLSFFNEKQIDEYVAQQMLILKNISPCLKPGKPLVYITCSVFKKENEDVVDYAVKHLGYRLDKKEYFTGYDKRADTLFAARLIK